MASYLTEDYFAPVYFQSVSPNSGPVRLERPGDAQILAAIVEMLRATGEFVRVDLGCAAAGGSFVGGGPIARVEPIDWLESVDGGAELLRTTRFRVLVEARDRDKPSSFTCADRLARRVQDVLDRADLGFHSVRGLTEIRRGHMDWRGGARGTRIVLEGRFAYPIESGTGRLGPV